MSDRWVLAPPAVGLGRGLSGLGRWRPRSRSALALIVQPERELGAASVFLLAVVVASVAGGIWAGSGARCWGSCPELLLHRAAPHAAGPQPRRRGRARGLPRRRAAGGVGRGPGRRRTRPGDASRARGPAAQPVRDQGAVRRAARSRAERSRGRARRRAPPGELRDPRGRGGPHVRGAAHAPGRRRWATPRGADLGRRGRVRDPARRRPRSARSSCPKTAGCSRRPRARSRSASSAPALDAEIAPRGSRPRRSQARAALFSSVTHDLRTPLASIKTAVTSLLQVECGSRPTRPGSCCRRSWRRPTGSTDWSATSSELAQVRSGALHPGEGADGRSTRSSSRSCIACEPTLGRGSGPDDLPRRSPRSPSTPC